MFKGRLQSQCSQIVQNNSQWSFSPDRIHQNFKNLHDRYLIIDNKIEIIRKISYLEKNKQNKIYKEKKTMDINIQLIFS